MGKEFHRGGPLVSQVSAVGGGLVWIVVRACVLCNVGDASSPKGV